MQVFGLVCGNSINDIQVLVQKRVFSSIRVTPINFNGYVI